jgi:Spy/CpxP family protein refolding chaperone
MRKIVLSIAVAGAALVAASPAAAQFYPQPQPQPAPYGYNNGYGNNNGYGYNNNWGQVRALQARINNVERQISRLDRRDVIRGRSADRLLNEANKIDRRLRDKARNGLDPREANDISFRIQRLEQQVQFALNDRGGRWGDRDDRWGHRND